MKHSIVTHPLVQHKLSLMRQAKTPSTEFRRLLKEISVLLAYEATRDLPLHSVDIQTPLGRGKFNMIEGKKLVIVSIMRAGNGILDGMLELIPGARVGHIGMYRDPHTHITIEYYFKLPPQVAERDMIVVDPMLATGGSAVAAVRRLKSFSPKRIRFVCLLASEKGLNTFKEAHPDVEVFCAAVDPEINENGYILPGLGDAGDRIYGTK